MVISKDHYEEFVELPDPLAAHIFLIAKKLSQAVRKACTPNAISHVFDDDVSKAGYNLVAHYKFHIIPRFKKDLDMIDWKALRTNESDGARSIFAKDIKKNLE